MNKTSFIIAEKSYLVRRGIIALLQELANVEILREVEANQELLRVVKAENPDVVIINAELCQFCASKGGLRKLLPTDCATKFVGITEQEVDLKRLGLDACISLHDSKTDIAQTINQYIKPDNNQGNELTQREKDIVRSIALGKTNKEIAESLFISPHTVITHRKNITHKLGIKSVSGLTVFAILNNLITVDEVNG